MFIGNLVKLKSTTTRDKKDKQFIENGIKEGWIWIITGMDNEYLDYLIQPLHLGEENYFIELGSRLLVLYDEIEKIEISKEELFEILNEQRCTC